MRMLWVRARLVVLGATSVIACSHAEVTVPCPLLACESGVIAHLASLPAAAFRVDITPRGSSGVVYSYSCAAASKCTQDIFFPGLVLDNFTVVVTVGASTRSSDIAPTYVTNQPNGPNCPPTCRTATVNVAVPT